MAEHPLTDKREWPPQKGDRVMLSDEFWNGTSGSSRRVGRRGGIVAGLHEYGVTVRWDGVKTPQSWCVDHLAPEDKSKLRGPPSKTERHPMTDKPSEMVAVVRRAIFDEAQRLGMSLTGPLIDGDPVALMARAALSAIEGMGYVIVPRKPTKEMLEQGAESLNDGDTLGCKYLAETAYYAMLSAALAEGKHEASPPKA